jgi:hypothetical protein
MHQPHERRRYGTPSVATHRTFAPSVLRSSGLRQPPRRSRVAWFRPGRALASGVASQLPRHHDPRPRRSQRPGPSAVGWRGGQWRRKTRPSLPRPDGLIWITHCCVIQLLIHLLRLLRGFRLTFEPLLEAGERLNMAFHPLEGREDSFESSEDFRVIGFHVGSPCFWPLPACAHQHPSV